MDKIKICVRDLNLYYGENHALKDVNMDILYPTEKLEYTDLNNNSMVAKISYNQFSIMFTRRYRKIRTKYSKRSKT